MSSTARLHPSRAVDDTGSAVTEFVLVGALLVFVACGLFQLALTLHVRNILVSSASEGAHIGALADRDPADGAARAEQLARAALGNVSVDASATLVPQGDGHVVVVRLEAPVPVLGLWGVGTISASAHAIDESDD